jgi:hypothetical protein
MCYFNLLDVSTVRATNTESPCPIAFTTEHLYDASSDLARLEIVRLGLFKVPPTYLLPSIVIAWLDLVQITFVATGLETYEHWIVTVWPPKMLSGPNQAKL